MNILRPFLYFLISDICISTYFLCIKHLECRCAGVGQWKAYTLCIALMRSLQPLDDVRDNAVASVSLYRDCCVLLLMKDVDLEVVHSTNTKLYNT